ncbi:hypothetical protein BSLG_004063 [Batrachochytrium salamandrivorans]|nr:hypothetical protein BSLG_004063 [Batrachochytrium salamandrivorans]
MSDRPPLRMPDRPPLRIPDRPPLRIPDRPPLRIPERATSPKTVLSSLANNGGVTSNNSSNSSLGSTQNMSINSSNSSGGGGDSIQPRKSSRSFSLVSMAALKTIGDDQKQPSNMGSPQRSITPPLTNKFPPAGPLSSPLSLSSQQSHSYLQQSQEDLNYQNDSSSLHSDLSSLAPRDLLSEANRMALDLRLKNKLLHDLKDRQNWLASEVAVLQSSGHQLDLTIDHSPVLESVLKHNDTSQMDSFKLELVQSLMHFRTELIKTRETVEQQEITLMDLGKKHTLAEDEVTYLKSIIDARRRNPTGSTSDLEARRINDLEASLRETSDDLSKVQAKVKQWAKASKRNQEGRIIAEACQNTAEHELSQVLTQLSKSKETEDTIRKRLDEARQTQAPHSNSSPRALELERAVDEKDQHISTLEASLATAQHRIEGFELTMQEAYTTVDALELETTTLHDQLDEKSRQLQSYEDRIDQLHKETDTLLQKHGSAQAELTLLKTKTLHLQQAVMTAEAAAKAAESRLAISKQIIENTASTDSDADTEADTTANGTSSPAKRSLEISSEDTGKPSPLHSQLIQGERRLNRDSKEIQIKVGDLQMENSVLSTANSKLQSELSAVNDTLLSMSEAHQALQINYQELQWNHEETRNTLQLLKERHKDVDRKEEGALHSEDKDGDSAALKDKMESLKNELELSSAALSAAKKEMDALKLHYHHLETSNASILASDPSSSERSLAANPSLHQDQSQEKTRELSTLSNLNTTQVHLEELEEAKKKIEELQKAILDTKAWNEEDAAKWKADIDRLEDLNDQSLERADTLEADLSAKVRLAYSLEDKLLVASEEIENLKSEMADIQSTAEKTKTIESEHAANFASLQEEIEDLQARLQDSQMIAISYTEQLTAKDAEYSSMEDLLQESEAQLDKSLHDLDECDAELARLREQFSEDAHTHELESARFKEQLAEANQRSETLSEEVSKAQAYTKSLEEDLEKSKAYQSELEINLQNEMHTVEQLRVQIASLQQPPSTSSTSRDLLSPTQSPEQAAESAALVEQLAQKEKQLKDLTSRVPQLEKHIRELSGDLAEITNANHSTFTELTSLKALLETTRADHTTSEAEKQECKAHLVALQRDAVAREQHILHLTGQLDGSAKDEDRVESLRADIQSRDEKIHLLETSIAELEISVNKLTAQLQEYSDHIQSLESAQADHASSRSISNQVTEHDHSEHLAIIEELKTQVLEKEKSTSLVEQQLEQMTAAKFEIEKETSVHVERVRELEEKLASSILATEQATADAQALLQAQQPDSTQLIDDLKAELEDKDNTIELLEQSLEQMENKEQELMAQMSQNMAAMDGTANIEQEMKLLKEKLVQIDADMERKDADLAALKEDLEMQSSIAEESSREVERYEIEVLSLRNAIEANAKQSTDTEGVDALKQQLAENDENRAGLHARLQQAESEIQTLQTISAQAQSQATQLEEDNMQYMAKISKLNERLAQADSQRRQTYDPTSQQATAAILKASQQQADDFTATIEELNMEVKNAYGKMASLLTEKSKMADQIDDLEEEKHNLQRKYQQLAAQLEQLKS